MSLATVHLRALQAASLAICTVLAATCYPQPVARADGPGGHIFLEAYGRCPSHPRSDRDAVVCGVTKFGNVTAGMFSPRKVEWGTAYSFNCGPKARWVGMGVILPDGDGGFPKTYVWRHARHGTGYRMNTQANMAGRTQLPVWFGLEAVALDTVCAWHVVSVEGTADQVRAAIPAIPPLYPAGTGAVPVSPPPDEGG